MAIAGMIFDIDGTLIDSNGAHAHAWAEALFEHGHGVPAERVQPLIGMGGDKLIQKLAGLADEDPLAQKIQARRQEIFLTRYLPQLKAQPCARSLLLALHERGVRLAVASSAKKEELQGLLKVIGVADKHLFEGKTTSDDAEHSKPDPDIVAAALHQLDLPAAQVLMVGDTPYDIEAAGRTGVRAIALRCGGWDDAHLSGAVAIFDDPADLLAQLDQVLG